MKPQLKIFDINPDLKQYANAIEGRHKFALQRAREFASATPFVDCANGYIYFGLHRSEHGWVMREWAPNATAVYLIGDFNGWTVDEKFALTPVGRGVWEIKIAENQIHHGQYYKLFVKWRGGEAERIPAWATRVVQNKTTLIFSAQVWAPDEEYKFKIRKFAPSRSPLLIYECHVGMSTEDGSVGTFNYFRTQILPRIAADGYNCIQLMAVQEHPYYGSFGYHVSNFFAVSSRFGTPDELKQLIDEAHARKIAVIMDLVHSHAIKNEREGLGLFDGTPHQYFHGGERRVHPAWDSLCFNYAKNEVLHFLLSNCKYWLEEFRFDGFRFDGVTSMIYRDHGLNRDFTSYNDYYNLNIDGDALCYLALANTLIHEVNPNAITIAEEMSGLPELCVPFEAGGVGFDYRLAMGVPDFWIKYIKEVPDNQWDPAHILYQLTNRAIYEPTITYAESHDQALVGDQTIIFRLIGADMYNHMQKTDASLAVNRGVALHKMIRLITIATNNGGYLNFMGNEFGHPEWIDFPRQGNNWSHHYARRQWSLCSNNSLLYASLALFDKEMVALMKSRRTLQKSRIEILAYNKSDQVLAFRRSDLVFVFNFNPERSFTGYGVKVKKGEYSMMLNTDSPRFGGFGLIDDSCVYPSMPLPAKRRGEQIKLYLPARTAIVLKKNSTK